MMFSTTTKPTPQPEWVIADIKLARLLLEHLGGIPHVLLTKEFGGSLESTNQLLGGDLKISLTFPKRGFAALLDEVDRFNKGDFIKIKRMGDIMDGSIGSNAKCGDNSVREMTTSEKMKHITQYFSEMDAAAKEVLSAERSQQVASTRLYEAQNRFRAAKENYNSAIAATMPKA